MKNIWSWSPTPLKNCSFLVKIRHFSLCKISTFPGELKKKSNITFYNFLGKYMMFLTICEEGTTLGHVLEHSLIFLKNDSKVLGSEYLPLVFLGLNLIKASGHSKFSDRVKFDKTSYNDKLY